LELNALSEWYSRNWAHCQTTVGDAKRRAATEGSTTRQKIDSPTVYRNFMLL
jgi:hypothetical protein